MFYDYDEKIALNSAYSDYFWNFKVGKNLYLCIKNLLNYLSFK